MREIRLWYTQPGPSGYTDRYFTPLLGRRWRVVLDPISPQYVISSCGKAEKGRAGRHFDYPEAVKIFFTGENLVPDFNLFDYAIGFHPLDFGSRYLRYPLWLFYLAEMGTKRFLPATQDAAVDRKFCNFVYSNNLHSDPIRKRLFDALSAYRPVDSGGGYLNNLGYRVGDKVAFLQDYKFTIAVENSLVEGYTTEKLIEPLMAGSIPIYWGNPALQTENIFNPDAVVVVESLEEAVKEVIRLDRDPEAYHQKLRQPIFAAGREPAEVLKQWEEELLDFLGAIFDQPAEKAIRRAQYGFNRHTTLRRARMERMADSWAFKKWYGLKEKLKH